MNCMMIDGNNWYLTKHFPMLIMFGKNSATGFWKLLNFHFQNFQSLAQWRLSLDTKCSDTVLSTWMLTCSGFSASLYQKWLYLWFSDKTEQSFYTNNVGDSDLRVSTVIYHFGVQMRNRLIAKIALVDQLLFEKCSLHDPAVHTQWNSGYNAISICTFSNYIS